MIKKIIVVMVFGLVSAMPVAGVEPTAAQDTTNAAPSQTGPAQPDMIYGDLVYGRADAPVEVVEYASMTCPHCATFANTIFPALKEQYIDTGKVRFVFRNFLLNRVDLMAATVTRCGDAEAAKKYIKGLFRSQHQWLHAPNPVEALAVEMNLMGLDRVGFNLCLANRTMHEDLIRMTEAGMKLYQVKGTPTIILNGVNVGNHGSDMLFRLIDDAL